MPPESWKGLDLDSTTPISHISHGKGTAEQARLQNTPPSLKLPFSMWTLHYLPFESGQKRVIHMWGLLKRPRPSWIQSVFVIVTLLYELVLTFPQLQIPGIPLMSFMLCIVAIVGIGPGYWNASRTPFGAPSTPGAPAGLSVVTISTYSENRLSSPRDKWQNPLTGVSNPVKNY